MDLIYAFGIWNEPHFILRLMASYNILDIWTSAYVDPSAITLAAIQIVFITLYIPCLATVLRFSLIPLQIMLLHPDQDRMQP